MAFRLAIQAFAYVSLNEELEKAKSAILRSLSLVHLLETESLDPLALPIKILLKKTLGDLKVAQGQSSEAIKAYNQAFRLLESSQYDPYQSPLKILSSDRVRSKTVGGGQPRLD